jgi:hypothetical protein
MMFYETSAIDGVNVENAFRDMARAALKREAGGALKLNTKTD